MAPSGVLGDRLSPGQTSSAAPPGQKVVRAPRKAPPRRSCPGAGFSTRLPENRRVGVPPIERRICLFYTNLDEPYGSFPEDPSFKAMLFTAWAKVGHSPQWP